MSETENPNSDEIGVTGAELMTIVLQLRADSSDEQVSRQALAAWHAARPPAPIQIPILPEEQGAQWGVEPTASFGTPGIRLVEPEESDS